MKRTCFILAISFLIFFVCNLKAQTTITGVVTDSLNAPIPFASVYLSRTTVGTTTNNKGEYILIIPQEGVYELIASCVGFNPNSQIVSSDGNMHWINISLTVNTFQIGELTIKAKNRHRIRDYAEFIKLFIGNSYNAQSCRIKNTEDLRLYESYEDKTIKGYSVKPLIIVNKALGYRIIYDLTDFSLDKKAGILRFSGYTYFQPLEGTPKKIRRWDKNRLTDYYGSRMHFLRSIIDDSLNKENYKLFEYSINPTTKEWSSNTPVPEYKLKTSINKNYTALYYSKILLLKYTDSHTEIPIGFMGYQPKEYQSTIVFLDTVKVYKNGFYENPYAITWEGDMSIERIADMLPFDYLPGAKNQMVNDSNRLESKFSKYFNAQQNTICRDQLFVHTDRNMYYPGDTLHFQAYVKDRLSGEFESNSTLMYAMLYNRQKELVDSVRFKIDGSTSSGWMAIPFNVKPGKYYFAAFTSGMQNYNPADAFHLDLYVDVLNYPIKVDVAFNKESYMPGDTLEATIKTIDSNWEPIIKQHFDCSLMSKGYSSETKESKTNSLGQSTIKFTIPDTLTNQPHLEVITQKSYRRESITKDFNIPIQDRYLDLRFLPEGGTLVAGIEQRIGFNATNRMGEAIYIEGLLKNVNGKVLDTIMSGAYGPGQFICIPEEGMYVDIIKGVFDQKRWPLPPISSSGVCLSVHPINNRSFAVEVQSNSNSSEQLFIAGTMDATVLFSKDLTLDKKKRFIVKTDDLPSGVAQITLFSKDMRPIAERLFYINADKHLRFNITTDSSAYKPGQETTLAISVTDGFGKPAEGIFSMAIVDSISGYNPEIFTPGIEYTLKYHPYLLGNLPPKMLVKGIENLTDKEIDLLFLVYGWKKYSWEFNQNNEIITQKSTDYDFLNMKILYAMKGRKSNRRLDLYSLEGLSISHLFTNKNGEISMHLDSLPDVTRTVMMFPDYYNKNKIWGSDISIPYNQKYFKSDSLFTRMPTIPAYLYNVHPSKTKSYIPLSERIIEIPELRFKGKKKRKTQISHSNIEFLDGNVLWSTSSFQEAFFKVAAPTITGGQVFFNPARGPKYASSGGPIHPAVPVVFIVDGVPDVYDNVCAIHPSNIVSLVVIKDYVDGGGVVMVTTKTKNPYLLKLQADWKIKHSKDKILLPIRIYRTNVEFYNPTKAEVDINPKLQHTPTIFWKQEIYCDGQTPVIIKYPNLKNVKQDKTVIITINGISPNNMAGTGRASYKVLNLN